MANKFKDEKRDALLSEQSDVYVTGLSDGSNASQIEVTVVARAVDDGMIYATETTWEHETKESNVHKITDSLRRTKENVAHRFHNLKDTVKTNVNHASLGVKTTAGNVTDTVKREVIAVDRKVKANPIFLQPVRLALDLFSGASSSRREKPKQTYALKTSSLKIIKQV